MRTARFAGWLAAMALAGAAQAQTPAATPRAVPRFEVEAKTVDAGEVLAGDVARARFVFHNSGKEPVHILRVKPG